MQGDKKGAEKKGQRKKSIELELVARTEKGPEK
jgi:hypothetical protein